MSEFEQWLKHNKPLIEQDFVTSHALAMAEAWMQLAWGYAWKKAYNKGYQDGFKTIKNESGWRGPD